MFQENIYQSLFFDKICKRFFTEKDVKVKKRPFRTPPKRKVTVLQCTIFEK